MTARSTLLKYGKPLGLCALALGAFMLSSIAVPEPSEAARLPRGLPGHCRIYRVCLAKYYVLGRPMCRRTSTQMSCSGPPPNVWPPVGRR